MIRIHRATRPRRYLAYAALLAALTSCSSTRGTADTRPNAQVVAPPVGVAAQRSILLPDSVASVNSYKDASLRSKPSLFNRATDAIGLSTPEGRARRHAVKLAKATAPKVGKGGVYAVNSTVSNGYKAEAPTSAAAPGATVSNAAENSQQQNVQGDNNDLHAKQANPTQQAKDWKAELASPVGKVVAGVAGLVLVGALGYGIFCFIGWRKKRSNPLA